MLTAAGKNKALDVLGIDMVSLHTADPGDTGANEVVGGTYARQTMAFNAASGGNIDSSNVPLFNIPAGVTITHYCHWSTTTVIDSGLLGSPESFGGAGTYRLDDADISIT